MSFGWALGSALTAGFLTFVGFDGGLPVHSTPAGAILMFAACFVGIGLTEMLDLRTASHLLVSSTPGAVVIWILSYRFVL